MSDNVKTGNIASMLLMYYADYPMTMVGPSKKNQIHFHEDLRIGKFYEKYANRYNANKHQTKANLEYYCKLHNINIINISNQHRKDLGDAFMQSIADYIL